MASASKRRLLAADDLWSGELVGVDGGGCRVLLARVGGRIVAYRDRCPHQGVRLSEGSLSGSTLTCRAHQFQFDLETGRCKNPRELRLDPLAVELVDGFIVLSESQDADG